MRKPHYWKIARRSSCPSNIFVFDCETWHGERARCPGGELQTFRLAVSVAYRLEKGRRTRESWQVSTRREDLLSHMLSRLSKSRPLWVFGHNLGYDLGAAGLWNLFRRPNFGVYRAILTPGVLFIKATIDDLPIVFCDTFNYYKTSLEKIGKELGFPKLPMPDQDWPDAQWVKYCRQDVEITARAVDSLIGFVRENDLGPWAPTVAGLSFSAYRHRFMTSKVLVHDDRRALCLERSAYFGGIVDTAFIGRVPASPVHCLDVCSMYPSVCEMPLPTRLAGYSDRAGLKALKTLSQQYMVFADVELSNADGSLPCRWKGKVYYAKGHIRTTLAHPELVRAISAGIVTKVHAMSWYHHAPIFREYMREMIAKKTAYREQGRDVFSTLAKYLANALYGKTGQQTPTWQEWGDKAFERLEEMHGIPTGELQRRAGPAPTLYDPEETFTFLDFDLVVKIRNYWGIVEVQTGESESRDSCPAIAASVTSYARCLLRDYQTVAGSRNWFYSDTDSLWVNDVGLANLQNAGCVAPNTVGKLTLEATAKQMTIHGPKDYETEFCRKLKGVKKNAIWNDDGSVTQLQFPSAAKQLHGWPFDGVMVHWITKRMRRTVDRCVVGPDGWTSPIVFE